MLTNQPKKYIIDANVLLYLTWAHSQKVGRKNRIGYQVVD